MCHRIFVFGLKVAIFLSILEAVESKADINEVINVVTDVFFIVTQAFLKICVQALHIAKNLSKLPKM